MFGKHKMQFDMQNFTLNQDDGSGKLYIITPYYDPKDWPRKEGFAFSALLLSSLPRVSKKPNYKWNRMETLIGEF